MRLERVTLFDSVILYVLSGASSFLLYYNVHYKSPNIVNRGATNNVQVDARLFDSILLLHVWSAYTFTFINTVNPTMLMCAF
jgi:hypothetical protein